MLKSKANMNFDAWATANANFSIKIPKMCVEFKSSATSQFEGSSELLAKSLLFFGDN